MTLWQSKMCWCNAQYCVLLQTILVHPSLNTILATVLRDFVESVMYVTIIDQMHFNIKVYNILLWSKNTLLDLLNVQQYSIHVRTKNIPYVLAKYNCGHSMFCYQATSENGTQLQTIRTDEFIKESLQKIEQCQYDR